MPAGDIDVYKRVDGKWAWRLKAANGQVVAVDGSQGYAHHSDALAMAIRVSHGDLMRDDLPPPDVDGPPPVA